VRKDCSKGEDRGGPHTGPGINAGEALHATCLVTRFAVTHQAIAAGVAADMWCYQRLASCSKSNQVCV
jgi:hypothetical protein